MKLIAPFAALAVLIVAGGCPPPEEPAAPPREPARPAPEAPPPTEPAPPTEPVEPTEPHVDDQQLEQRITQRIQEDQMLSPTAQQMVMVRVQNGIVTLTGEVETQNESQRIEQMVFQVQGVQDVDNQLHVLDEELPDDEWDEGQPQ